MLAAGNCQSDINVEPDASLPLFGCSNWQHDYSYSICVFFDVGIMFHRHRYRNHSSASLLSSHYHHYRPRTGAIVGHFHLSESHGYWCQSFDDHCGLLLATGPGNRPAVQVLAGGSVQFGSRPGQKPDPLLSADLLPGPGIYPEVFGPVGTGLRLQLYVSETLASNQVFELSLYCDMISM